MCGICGNIMIDRSAPVEEEVVLRMVDALRHRGPDDSNVVVGLGYGLGHARLSILDLHRRARQPMPNEDGNLLLVFNGAIYNYRELRDDLLARGHGFRSCTDGEVILHLYEEHGVECLSHLRGMFAFAIYDLRDHTLFAARDRVGKKPLVYSLIGDRFVFASELQAMMCDPRVSASPDPEAIHLYLSYGYVPAPRTAFKGIFKLPPAHYLRLRSGRIEIQPYWKLSYDEDLSGRAQSQDEVAHALRHTLEEAVKIRRVSDVPIGVLLSGGLDSGAVAALLARHATVPIRTFSIGFEDRNYDESKYAQFLSQRIGSEHTEWVVKPEAACLLPDWVRHHGEPFADSSAIPTFCLAKLASEQVKVVLTGDGGDECFGGYDRYRAALALSHLAFSPSFLRRFVGRTGSALLSKYARGDPGGVSKWQRFLSQAGSSPETAYYHWLGFVSDTAKEKLYTPGFREETSHLWAGSLMADAFQRSEALDLPGRLLDVDRQLYLPGDLLAKMDIATMAHGLEGRSPFLDHKVMEFAAKIPGRLKLNLLRSKCILKKAVHPYLPDAIVNRPKKGFGVPVHAWLRSELKEMAYDLLTGPGAAVRDWFAMEEVRRQLDAHCSGKECHHNTIWALLIFELWHRIFIDPPRPADDQRRL
ncbi:MAG: asparagine synthase (glutamine-hydrolyzing) [Planctomycetota bacterium]